MSILHSLRRLIDPNAARIERAEVKAEQQRPRRDDEGDGKPPKRYVCHACGHEGTDPAYCPHCLADTMRPVDKRR